MYSSCCPYCFKSALGKLLSIFKSLHEIVPIQWALSGHCAGNRATITDLDVFYYDTEYGFRILIEMCRW